jgi:hypothetical protein
MPYWVAAAEVVGGALIQGDAAKSAANTQAGAANNATQAQLSMFNTTQQNLSPFIKSGTNALGTLNSELGIGPGGTFNPNAPLVKPFTASDYQQSPGYAWEKSQGIDAVQNSASAGGGIKGGNTLKALDTFGTGLASTDFQQAWQNYMAQQQQQYGMLNNLVGSGQNAAAGLGAISANVGGQVGSNIIGAGNARAAGQIGQANAVTGGLNSLAQIAFLQQNGGSAGASPYVAGTPYGSGANTGFYCDYALKSDIEPLYVDHASGLQVYSFRYKTEDGRWMGYIAQDVQKKYPNAVSVGPKGFLMVDYSKIPAASLRKPTPEEWDELHEHAGALA